MPSKSKRTERLRIEELTQKNGSKIIGIVCILACSAGASEPRLCNGIDGRQDGAAQCEWAGLLAAAAVGAGGWNVPANVSTTTRVPANSP